MKKLVFTSEGLVRSCVAVNRKTEMNCLYGVPTEYGAPDLSKIKIEPGEPAF